MRSFDSLSQFQLEKSEKGEESNVFLGLLRIFQNVEKRLDGNFNEFLFLD